MLDDDDDEQDLAWETLYDGIVGVLKEFGIDDPFGNGDYLIVDDNYGHRRNIVEIHKLHMLRPEIANALRALLDNYPDWEIVIAVDIPGTETTWPRMGLTIRKHEIIDGLQREFLPEDVRKFNYPDSRPGTGYD